MPGEPGTRDEGRFLETCGQTQRIQHEFERQLARRYDAASERFVGCRQIAAWLAQLPDSANSGDIYALLP